MNDPRAAGADGAFEETSRRPMRQRILLVGDLPPPAHGQAMSFQLLCRRLSCYGYTCRIVDFRRRRTSPWSRLSATRSVEVLRALVEFAVGLVKRFRLAYILIAQSRAGFLRDMVMIWSAWACRCRIVVHLHGGNYDGFYRAQPRPWRFAIRHTLRRVDRIVALSERLRGMYAFDPALQEKVAVVMNSPSEEMKGKPRLVGDRPERVVRLLFLSNMIQSKGYHDVLEAVKILKRTTTMRLEAMFAGIFMSSADDREALSPKAAEAAFLDAVDGSGLAGVVRYLGAVSGDAKRRLLDASDFLLLPTNYVNEGQPIAIIEAMASGCVVIATDYRSIPDLVVDGETGVLVDYGRPEQIANAVREISADAERYAMMSRAAVERYERFFTVARHLNAMASVLRSV